MLVNTFLQYFLGFFIKMLLTNNTTFDIITISKRGGD
nr:MAG TPA: hypothetical protein [Caudoviricetes sp.]